MDWRIVDDEKWADVYNALNGAGVESMQAKWDEMFGLQEDKVAEGEVKVKKPLKKTTPKKVDKEKKTVVKRKTETSKAGKTKFKKSPR